MIKDTLLPTVQKTHIGKYRTFPDNLQTAERHWQQLSVLKDSSPSQLWEGKVQATSALLMMTYLSRVQKEWPSKGTVEGKDTIVYHMERGTNSLNFFFSFFQEPSAYGLT